MRCGRRTVKIDAADKERESAEKAVAHLHLPVGGGVAGHVEQLRGREELRCRIAGKEHVFFGHGKLQLDLLAADAQQLVHARKSFAV